MTARDLIVSALAGDAAPWPAEAEAFEAAVREAAAEHGVAALLAMAPGARAWPGRVRTHLVQTLRIEAAAEAIRQQEIRRLLAGLADAAVRPLLLKGAQLAYSHYQHPWLRPRLDTDVMVAPGERRRSDGILRALGYRAGNDFGGELVSHQFQYERPNQYGFADHVDLHWRIANPHVFAAAFSFEELDREAVPVAALGPHARGLSPVHALILACVHRVAHHRNSERLIWLYDIHLLAGTLGAEERDTFVDLALARRLSSVCLEGLARAQACFGTAAPHGWLDRLRAASPESEPAAVFLKANRTKLDVLRSDLRELGGWSSKLKLLREHLFPPAAYIRRTYGFSNPAILPFAYAFRIAKGVGRWGRSHD